MSKAYRCDICGAFFDSYNGIDLPYYEVEQDETMRYAEKIETTNQLYFANQDYRHSFGKIKQELCPECMISFKKWLLERHELRKNNIPNETPDLSSREAYDNYVTNMILNSYDY